MINITNTISNTKLNYSSIDNLAFSSKSFKDYLFPSKNYIKPIFANSNIKTGVIISNNKLNNLNNLIPKQNENYNLNNYLDTNLNNGLENEVDITILDILNSSSSNPKLINDTKLVNIVTNNGTNVYNSSSIGDSIEDYNIGHKFNENINIVQPSKIINLNKKLFTNDNLESFSISHAETNKSLTEDNNLTELIEIRKLLHNK